MNLAIDPFRGGPLQLVEHAVASRDEERRAERRGRGRARDEIWCVLDVDEHPNVEQAIALAEAHGIRLAISNPCLELWFLLHFVDQQAWIHRAEAQRRATAALGCGKVLTPKALDALRQRYDDAASRARQLEEKHRGDGSPPGANPSSGLWRLIHSIRAG